jgi:GxxExxY protein
MTTGLGAAQSIGSGEPSRGSAGLRHGDLTGDILSAFYRVYGELGYGFLEQVYLRSLAIELGLRGIPVSREAPVNVFYRGVTVGSFRADLIVGHEVVVEVKAGEHMMDADRFQLLNYLRCSGKEVGLLLHFGPRATFKRVICTRRGTAVDIVPPDPAGHA